MALKQTLTALTAGLLALAAAATQAVAADTAAAAVRPAATTDSGPTRYHFDNHVRFIVGSKMDLDAWGRIHAWYGWAASDPDGICYQSLYSEEYTTDYPQVFVELAGTARRAKFHIITDNLEDDAASSYVEYEVHDCLGNSTEEFIDAFAVDQLQEDELAYTGDWRTVKARKWSHGAGRTARMAGATVTIPFWHSLGIVMPTGPTKGSFDLYVDGRFRQTVSLRRATASVRRVVAAVDMGNAPGDHTAELRTRSGRPVTIDAALIS